jgi:hypothetical protein
MANLEMPRWPDEKNDASAGGGLLDGLPTPVWGTGLNFLLGETGEQSDPLTIGQVDPDALVLGRPDGNYHPVQGPKNPIGPVQRYPETGKNSWRASNDDVIVAAVNKYNAANGYQAMRNI